MRHQTLLMEDSTRPALAATPVPELHELLTVEEVAALLKVSKSWVYEHTRSRTVAPAERLRTFGSASTFASMSVI